MTDYIRKYWRDKRFIWFLIDILDWTIDICNILIDEDQEEFNGWEFYFWLGISRTNISKVQKDFSKQLHFLLLRDHYFPNTITNDEKTNVDSQKRKVNMKVAVKILIEHIHTVSLLSPRHENMSSDKATFGCTMYMKRICIR